MTLYESVKDLGIYKHKNVKGTFGLEIEAETPTVASYPKDFFDQGKMNYDGKYYAESLKDHWNIVLDDSLRNFGLEFIFAKPLDLIPAKAALDVFAEATKKVEFIKDAPATSVHVHLNFLHETFLTLGNFLTLYTLFENLLVEYCGQDRRSNLFALPMRCAEETHINIQRLFKQLEKKQPFFMNFDSNTTKYAALNLSRLRNLGTLEIRSFRGTTDVSAIKEWLEILQRMLWYSRQVGLTPPVIISEYRDKGAELLTDVFGWKSTAFKQKVEESSGLPAKVMMDRNLWYAAMIADTIEDWPSINDAFKDYKKPEKVPYGAKKLDAFGEPVNWGQLVNQAQEMMAQPPVGWEVIEDMPEPDFIEDDIEEDDD